MYYLHHGCCLYSGRESQSLLYPCIQEQGGGAHQRFQDSGEEPSMHQSCHVRTFSTNQQAANIIAEMLYLIHSQCANDHYYLSLTALRLKRNVSALIQDSLG